jgi:hypothetical protein
MEALSMSEIDRVRKDLETIREAAGLDLPFGWEDVWLSLAAIPLGGILAALGAFSPLRHARLAIIPALLLLLGAAALRGRYRQSTGRSPVRRKEYSLGLGAALLFAIIVGGFLAWAQHLGQPIQMAGGLAVAMTGGLYAVLGATSPGRRSSFAAAVALLAYGLVIPVCSPRQVVVAGGVTMAFIGLGAAAIQASQLRKGVYERVAH